MLKKTKKGYFVSTKLNQYPKLVHGFSTRQFGDLKTNPHKFLQTLNLKLNDLILMDQVHGNKIKVVFGSDKKKTIPQTDGLVTNQKGIVLAVKTADCLPILFYSPTAGLIGVAHAGWPGILKKICQKMVEVMIKLGALPENIIVISGPFIGPCCYNIERSRADKFLREFGKIQGMIQRRRNKLYLNLSLPVVDQLMLSGLSQDNIEFYSLCTSCQNKEFFSFRKNDSERMLGVISLIN